MNIAFECYMDAFMPHWSRLNSPLVHSLHNSMIISAMLLVIAWLLKRLRPRKRNRVNIEDEYLYTQPEDDIEPNYDADSFE